EFWVLDWEREFANGILSPGHFRAVVESHRLERAAIPRAPSAHSDAQNARINVRSELHGFDACVGRHWFEPYGLPNSAGGGVEDSLVGAANLFAAGIGTGVGRVPNQEQDFILPVLAQS